MKYGNIRWILHGWDDKKKTTFGTMRRKKSGELLRMKTDIINCLKCALNILKEKQEDERWIKAFKR